MSKKYKDKICVYCAENISTTGDHVFAREFFLPEERTKLPKVPSCIHCNNEKSELEHYLTAVLPFGGRHESASKNLSTMVPKRLERNRKLHLDLDRRSNYALVDEPDGQEAKCMTLPIDGDKYIELFTYVTKGLIWHHWNTLLSKEFSVATAALTSHGVDFFNKHFMTLRFASRVVEIVGNKNFTYIGLQAVDIPQISVWQFMVYSGVMVAESNDSFFESSIIIGAVSGPNKIINEYKEIFRPAT